MRRRDFLKLAGASLCIGGVTNVAANKVMEKKPELAVDVLRKWVDDIKKAEQDEMFSQLGKAANSSPKPKKIFVSQELMDELIKSVFVRPEMNYSLDKRRPFKFGGIPLQVSDYLPVVQTDGKVVHAIVLNQALHELWRWRPLTFA